MDRTTVVSSTADSKLILSFVTSFMFLNLCDFLHYVRIQRGDRGVRCPSTTGPGPLKNHKATKPAFNFGPLSAR